MRSSGLAVIAAALIGCAADPIDPSIEAQEAPLRQPSLEARVQRLADLQELRGLLDCYGTGHDLIFKDLGGAHREALEVLRRCHVEDLVTNVFLFDESTPVQRLASLPALVGFIDAFAQQNGYSSARNVPGNVRIELVDATTARIASSTAAPHFLTRGPAATSDRPTLDLVEARYLDTARRGRDGTWRVVARDLVVQQIWRGEGAYPFASP
jgi:hypothetical protein